MIIYGRELRKTPSYRVWIDEKNVAHFRLVKRINFKTFIGLCRESYLAIDKETELHELHPRIIIYIPRSLYDEMSENVSEFIMFCRSCTDATFELSIIG
ncbi:hypothetical protein [Methanoregula sp.]|jgi:hypothetical protein|uniref:hypothetical protein n=1 Tax=Methanoregula sp. TaxID=2052170 RepID=UPI003C726AEB